MKIKNSIDKLKADILLTVFFFATLVGIVLRTLQMFRYIEPDTGFNTGAGWLMALIYVIAFGCLAAFCIVSYLSKDTDSQQPMGIKDKVCGIFTLVFAVALVGNWISSFFEFFDSLANDVTNTGFRGFMSSGVITYFVQSVFAFFSAIYFVVFAFDILRGTVKANKLKLLALAPVGWASVRLVHRFIRQISFIKVSDLLLELVMLACLVLFFMALAQVVSGVNSTGFEWRITGYGLSAALVALIINAARFTYGIVMGFSTLNENHLFSLVDVSFALFAVVLINTLNKKTKEV